uniref:Oxidation resistance protein 1 n=1 Tax=Strigamia maritima TaxID=126957 RepID=T1JKI4_STRMM
MKEYLARLLRKKTGQVSSGSKGSKSYVIPTGSKIKSVDSHGYSNSAFDWNTMNKQTGEDLIQLSSEQKLHAKLILKSATEPCKRNDDEKKDRKHVTRTMTQPSGTITYTVKSSDTLTGIAARYDTTPSELVKLNRLASRFIFPDQILFVPAKNLESSEQSSDVDVGSCGDGGGDIQQNTSHKSPKPGHVERIQSPPLSPRTHILTEDEEKNLDKDCIERFLKINVRHITDGQGVVSGVLLVTPNAVMFDPNVSDQLVIEHGAEKYGVIAPMDYVVNAAMYNDIATMFVSHAYTDSMQIHSPPQVYHARECRLSWPMNNLDTLASARERRTDSIQAINGSMSDVGVTPDEDSSRENQSIKQMHHMSTSDSTSNLDSEVFVDEETRNQEAPTTSETQSQPEPEASYANIQEAETKESVSAFACNQEILPEKDEVPATDIEEATKVSDDGAKGEQNELPSNNDPLQQQQSVTAAATNPSEQVLTESLRRKNSNIFENKMKALKQLSYPLTWMESIGGSDKDKENSPPLSSLSEAVSTASSTTQPAQSTLSKIFSSASPKTLVDFSSGFFTKTADEGGSQEEITFSSPKKSSIRPASLHESTVTGNSVFYDENGQKSGKSQVASIERRPHSMGESRERKVGFKSIVSVDDMPDLFASIDQLIPRPAKACDDPPLYLCLRMGKPLNKPVHKSTPIMAYGKKRMKREYWFSIPRDRVDDLYSFFNHWAPNVYGDLDEEAIRKFGYELITNEEEFSDDEHKLRRDSDDTPQSVEEDTHRTDWEVVSASDLKKQMSLEAEPELPELYGESELLTDEVRRALVQHLPARAVGYGWTLIFSTESDGCSLKNLYRKMTNFETPVLLIIKDKENNVFGAMTSCTLKPSDHFYGTGESFLFSFYPEFEIFRWTGENEYFIKGNPESLAIGSGDGEFGLWLDGNLDRGRTHPCKTYANTTLSSESDFFVKSLETWGFVQVDIGKPL